MDRDLKYLSDDPKEREFVKYIRCSINTTTIQLTLITTLEAIIPNISTRDSINIHIIGAARAEYGSIPTFEELLYLLPSLKVLRFSFMSLNVTKDPRNNLETRNIHILECCTVCAKMKRSVLITTWKGPYHAYVDTKFYKTPDLAAAFHSGFSVDEQAD
jgi:splicing suppressor protein 51